MTSVMKKNLIYFPILSIVCVIFFILACVFFNAATESIESANNIKSFADLDAFCTVDATNDDKLYELLDNSEDTVARCKSFFNALEASNIKHYTEYGYEMPIINDVGVVSELNVSDGFFEAFGITAYEGRLFTLEEYESLPDELPVVIGYELRDKYELGRVYQFQSTSMETTFSGRIVGVLKKNSSYCRLSAPMFPILMDNLCIFPLGLERLTIVQDVPDFDMALSHTVFFFRDNSEVELVNSLIEQMDTFTLNINSVKSDYNAALENSTKMYIVMGLILFVLLSIILLVAYISFSRILRAADRLIGLRLMVGANKLHMLFKLFLIVVLFVSMTALPSFLRFGTHSNMLFLIIASVIILSVLVLALPAYRIMKIDIADMIYREGK